MKIACLIPYHRQFDDAETFAIKHGTDIIRGVDCFVMQEDGRLPKLIDNVTVYEPPTGTLSSIQSYNDFLLSKKLYLDFDDYDRLIIIQHDAIVLNDFICEYLPYSFFGSPFGEQKILNKFWFGPYPRLGHALTRLGYGTHYAYGNGGFSIRDVKFCSTYALNLEHNTSISLRGAPIIGIREDVYWSWAARNHGAFTTNKAIIKKFGLDQPTDENVPDLDSIMCLHDSRMSAPRLHARALRYIGYTIGTQDPHISKTN